MATMAWAYAACLASSPAGMVSFHCVDGVPTCTLLASGTVFGDRVEVKDPRARARPHRAAAFVLTVERPLVRPQRPHHDGGQIVLAVHASGVAARYEEESRSVVDLHPPGMRGATYTGPVLDLELEAHQVGLLFEEPGRIVLAPPSLRESLSLRAVLAVVHRHAPQRNHFETFALVS